MMLCYWIISVSSGVHSRKTIHVKTSMCFGKFFRKHLAYEFSYLSAQASTRILLCVCVMVSWRQLIVNHLEPVKHFFSICASVCQMSALGRSLHPKIENRQFFFFWRNAPIFGTALYADNWQKWSYKTTWQCKNCLAGQLAWALASSTNSWQHWELSTGQNT